MDLFCFIVHYSLSLNYGCRFAGKVGEMDMPRIAGRVVANTRRARCLIWSNRNAERLDALPIKQNVPFFRYPASKMEELRFAAQSYTSTFIVIVLHLRCHHSLSTRIGGFQSYFRACEAQAPMPKRYILQQRLFLLASCS